MIFNIRRSTKSLIKQPEYTYTLPRIWILVIEDDTQLFIIIQHLQRIGYSWSSGKFLYITDIRKRIPCQLWGFSELKILQHSSIGYASSINKDPQKISVEFLTQIKL